MLGYTSGDLASGLIRWDQRVAPGSEHVTGCIEEQLQTTGRASQVELAFLRKDNSVVHTLMGLAALDHDGGAAIGFMLDLTERKRMEKQLRDSEEKFQQFAAGLHEVLWLLDAATFQILFVSPAYEQIWQQSCESLYRIGHAWMEAIHPEDRAAAEAIFRRQLGGETADNEYRITQPDGAVRWILDRAFPIRNQVGKIAAAWPAWRRM